MTPEEILVRHARALDRRRAQDALWQDCYDHVLPPASGGRVAIFDATAADAAEQLAASLLAELTPPWSRWFGLAPSRSLEGDAEAAAALEETAETLQGHLDRSNFALEMHQAFLDLVIAGTGILLVEEAPLGEASALRFTAVPLREAVLEEGASGRFDNTVFRAARFERLRGCGNATRARRCRRAGEEARPRRGTRGRGGLADRRGHRFMARRATDRGAGAAVRRAVQRQSLHRLPLAEGAGRGYGRGPVAKALPDIRTPTRWWSWWC